MNPVQDCNTKARKVIIKAKIIKLSGSVYYFGMILEKIPTQG
jgi:hypothetical protein